MIIYQIKKIKRKRENIGKYFSRLPFFLSQRVYASVHLPVFPSSRVHAVYVSSSSRMQEVHVFPYNRTNEASVSTPPRYFTRLYVSVAITNSSLVVTETSFTRESGVERIPSWPASLSFSALSRVQPKNSRPSQIASRWNQAFSPIPPVKSNRSQPPISAM